MINVEQAVSAKFPTLSQQPRLIRQSTLRLLRRLTHEAEINRFLDEHQGKSAIDFIDSVFEYFNFSYSVSSRERGNIPDQGRVVIIANHPIGSLDGLAILRMVSEVRPDVKILANDLLMHFADLQPLLIAADNMAGKGAITTFRRALEALQQEQALIIFPAGEVSRARPSGVRDTRWLPGFLKLARRSGAPLLPVHIRAKNSLWFYSASMLYKPLGTALLAQEMFNKQSVNIHFRIGEPIPAAALHSASLTDKALLRRLRKHLYKLGRKRSRPAFVTEKTIAHPEDRRLLLAEVAAMQLLGETRDGMAILLTRYEQSPVMMREIGRLREIAFRRVGEGTGGKRDLDRYDRSYLHLILWDQQALAVAGAYRLGDTARLLREHGEQGLYTRSLFSFQPALRDYLKQGLELGRSFVSPDYWGKNSLDYLWQGIGAYLRHRPEVRYLVGPVSVSADLPSSLRDQLVHFYRTYYACPQPLACANHPYRLDLQQRMRLERAWEGLDRDTALRQLQEAFAAQGHKLPVLFKQYAALFEEGGFQLLSFSVDPDFGDCLDGLCVADLTCMKAGKRKRYLD